MQNRYQCFKNTVTFFMILSPNRNLDVHNYKVYPRKRNKFIFCSQITQLLQVLRNKTFTVFELNLIP